MRPILRRFRSWLVCRWGTGHDWRELECYKVNRTIPVIHSHHGPLGFCEDRHGKVRCFRCGAVTVSDYLTDVIPKG